MQFLDVPKRCWSREILDLLDVDPGLLADVYESYLVTGRVSKEAAALTGLKEGTPVVGGAGDQAAGGVGNGIVKAGVVSATIGTSGVVFAYSDSLKMDPQGRTQTFCHAVPGAWHIMGVMKSAGLSLKWFRDQFCNEEKAVAALMDVDPYVLMDKECEKSPPGAKSLIYLPYLMGERTPHLDDDAKGVFFGLTPSHTKADFIRSVMEGVAFAMNDCLNIIKETGVPVQEIRASGGGGRSKIWKSIQANVYKSDVKTVNATEGRFRRRPLGGRRRRHIQERRRSLRCGYKNQRGSKARSIDPKDLRRVLRLVPVVVPVFERGLQKIKRAFVRVRGYYEFRTKCKNFKGMLGKKTAGDYKNRGRYLP